MVDFPENSSKKKKTCLYYLTEQQYERVKNTLELEKMLFISNNIAVFRLHVVRTRKVWRIQFFVIFVPQ